MDCRHPLVPTVAGMLLVAGARVHAGEAGTPGRLQVTGGDFPALVMVGTNGWRQSIASLRERACAQRAL